VSKPDRARDPRRVHVANADGLIKRIPNEPGYATPFPPMSMPNDVVQLIKTAAQSRDEEHAENNAKLQSKYGPDMEEQNAARAAAHEEEKRNAGM
jgi:hypothetical protein